MPKFAWRFLNNIFFAGGRRENEPFRCRGSCLDVDWINSDRDEDKERHRHSRSRALVRYHIPPLYEFWTIDAPTHPVIARASCFFEYCQPKLNQVAQIIRRLSAARGSECIVNSDKAGEFFRQRHTYPGAETSIEVLESKTSSKYSESSGKTFSHTMMPSCSAFLPDEVLLEDFSPSSNPGLYGAERYIQDSAISS